MKGITKRISTLEQKICKLAGCLSFEQFLEEWDTMDDLSRAVLITYAECPEMQEGASEGERRIYSYLRDLGAVLCVCDLDDILEGVAD